MNSAQNAEHENMLSAMRSGSGKYTKADVEAMCSIAVAAALRGVELQTARAVADEREACARLAEQWASARTDEGGGNALRNCAQAMRERSNVKWTDAQTIPPSA